MDILHSLTDIPPQIAALQRFGVGSFSEKQRRRKCAQIRTIMDGRPPVWPRPLFSVIVPVYKETRCLLATLRSLAEQTNTDAEFIIVSNGEPRGNPTQRMAEQAGFRVLHERRGGVGSARQRGLMEARGKIIVTTDADTLHDPGWLDAIVDEWKRNPHLAAGFGWVHMLTSSPAYQGWMQIQNMCRSLQGRHFFICAAEANSWFLRDAAVRAGGYEEDARYYEGAPLMKKMCAVGELQCAWDTRAAVYTSDRRTLNDRLCALLQFFSEGRHVKYQPVR